MSDQIAYLDRSLERRADELGKTIQLAIDTVMRQNAAVGRLGSGATIIAFNNEAKRIFTEEFGKAAQFTFNLLGSVSAPAYAAMDTFSKKAEFMIMHVIKNSAARIRARRRRER